MSRLRLISEYLPYIPRIIWFNFHYLPWKQAFKLPILLRKPRFKGCRGSVSIEGPITTGMIRLGADAVAIYPNRGIVWESDGNIIFSGKCLIGNDSYIAVGPKGQLRFGNNFTATSTIRIVCYNQIHFDEDVLVGWENLFCDTDFHRIQSDINSQGRGYGPIRIGRNNWFAMKCTILKNTTTPDDCIICANSLLIQDYSQLQKRCMLAGTPAKLIKTGVWRDMNNDKIIYE